jgi:hypothetical protein
MLLNNSDSSQTKIKKNNSKQSEATHTILELNSMRGLTTYLHLATRLRSPVLMILRKEGHRGRWRRRCWRRRRRRRRRRRLLLSARRRWRWRNRSGYNYCSYDRDDAMQKI